MEPILSTRGRARQTPFLRPVQRADDGWKTVQCVTAPKVISMAAKVERPRTPPDTSGFVLVKFQVVSVAPEEVPRQEEAAARALHAMGNAGPQRQDLNATTETLAFPYVSNEPCTEARNPTLLYPHTRLVQKRYHRTGGAVDASEEGCGSSSGGSVLREMYRCHYPGCAKVSQG